MTVLHIGCGTRRIPEMFSGHVETRLDIAADVKPDVLASMTDIPDIGAYDVVYASHCLEHLRPHEVKKALREFKRVTIGFALIIVPDLEGLEISDKPLYICDSGQPVSALDMIYGAAHFAENNPYMEHHCGFTREILMREVKEAGFKSAIAFRSNFNLCVVAFPVAPPEGTIERVTTLMAIQ